MTTQTVITYQWAYVAGTIELCPAHDDSTSAGGALGPVSHGAHDGTCDVCEMVAAVSDKEIEALRYEAGVAGDLDQVALCTAALGGDVGALAECARVIRSAQE